MSLLAETLRGLTEECHGLDLRPDRLANLEVERLSGALGDAGKKRGCTKAELHQDVARCVGLGNGCHLPPENVEDAAGWWLLQRQADIAGMDAAAQAVADGFRPAANVNASAGEGEFGQVILFVRRNRCLDDDTRIIGKRLRQIDARQGFGQRAAGYAFA